MIRELRHIHRITLLLGIAGIARSTYYYHVKQLEKPDKYATIKQEMSAIYEENRRRVGYRRITLELHNRGYRINHKTVQRLMRQLGLFCHVRMKKYNSYRGEVGEIAPNLLQRNFHADNPNEKWVTDVTEFSLFGQKLYLSPILDLYNSEIVSCSISHHPRFSQTVDMLEKAFRRLPDNPNLILHSDQGWQYQMKPYQRMLAAKGIRQSMSRKGNCLDNAVMENFFGILKSELLYLQDFASMEHFKHELIDYLDYYNNRPIKLKIERHVPGAIPVTYPSFCLIHFLSNFLGAFQNQAAIMRAEKVPASQNSRRDMTGTKSNSSFPGTRASGNDTLHAGKCVRSERADARGGVRKS